MTIGSSGRAVPASGSIENPKYWWYEARAELLATVFGPRLEGGRLLDIGSADGPSVGWLGERVQRFAVDRDPSGLTARGVCADATQLPFRTASFDSVSAFDVVEHVPADRDILDEIARVVRPGGQVLISVPAYQWAWSDFDVRAGHYRRYTRRSIVETLEKSGFEIERATYAFAATFPFFAVDRLLGRLTGRGVERVSESRMPRLVGTLLSSLAWIDAWLLRFTDLPFGSSVFVAATSPQRRF